MNKKELSERDFCTKFITPAIENAGWDIHTQVLEEFHLTKGRVIDRGQLHSRTKNKREDYVLFCKPNIPVIARDLLKNELIHALGVGNS